MILNKYLVVVNSDSVSNNNTVNFYEYDTTNNKIINEINIYRKFKKYTFGCITIENYNSCIYNNTYCLIYVCTFLKKIKI